MPDLTEFRETQLAKLSPEKQKIVMAFERFQHSGFKKTLFTKAIYHTLSQYCGFIAHYNLHGFYEARFCGADNVLETLLMLASMKWPHADNADLVKEFQHSATLNMNCWEKLAQSEASEETRELRERANKLERKFP